MGMGPELNPNQLFTNDIHEHLSRLELQTSPFLDVLLISPKQNWMVQYAEGNWFCEYRLVSMSIKAIIP